MTFWRSQNKRTIAAAETHIHEYQLEQLGYTRTDQTTPAAEYYLPGKYDTPADPRTWERITGRPAMRRAEWDALHCPICGRADCPGHQHIRSQRSRKWHTDRPNYAQYYAQGNLVVGVAYNVEQAALYHKWTVIDRREAIRLARAGAPCIIGGHVVSTPDFLAVVAYRNRKWYEVLTKELQSYRRLTTRR